MPAIIEGIINFNRVIRNDVFDFAFDLKTNIDLSGKNIVCQVRLNANDKLLLEFKESDESLRVGDPVTIEGTDKTQRTISLHMDANKMLLSANVYRHGFMIYSNATDRQVIITGVFKVVDEIPKI